MAHPFELQDGGRPAVRGLSLQFTPAEWHRLLENRSFLNDPDNRFRPPRRLLGVPVEIVPDHLAG